MNEKSYLVIQYIKQSVEPIPAKNIQSKLVEDGFKIDIKTVYEIIRKINLFYKPLLQDDYIGVIRRKGYYIEHPIFDDGQLQYMIDSIRFNPMLGKKETDIFIDKLMHFSDKNQMCHLDVEVGLKTGDLGLLHSLNILLQAIQKSSNVYFQYIDYEVIQGDIVEVASARGNLFVSDKSFYCVSPYRIVMHNQYYYLIAYCNKRPTQLSVYRVDRIRLLRKHKSEFVEIREQFDMESEIKQTVNMFMSDQKIDLEIKFVQSAMKEIVNRFGKEYKVVQKGKDYVCTIQDVTYSKGLIGWILMLQDQIEVISPISVRNDLKEQIQYLANKY